MRNINIHEAKTHLSRILEDVAAGESVIIAKAGTPIAKIVPLTAERSKRTLGVLKGKFTVGSDFDAALPDDVLKKFEH